MTQVINNLQQAADHAAQQINSQQTLAPKCVLDRPSEKVDQSMFSSR